MCNGLAHIVQNPTDLDKTLNLRIFPRRKTNKNIYDHFTTKVFRGLFRYILLSYWNEILQILEKCDKLKKIPFL